MKWILKKKVHSKSNLQLEYFSYLYLEGSMWSLYRNVLCRNTKKYVKFSSIRKELFLNSRWISFTFSYFQYFKKYKLFKRKTAILPVILTKIQSFSRCLLQPSSSQVYFASENLWTLSLKTFFFKIKANNFYQ